MDRQKFARRLWGDVWLDENTRQFKKQAPGYGCI